MSIAGLTRTKANPATANPHVKLVRQVRSKAHLLLAEPRVNAGVNQGVAQLPR